MSDADPTAETGNPVLRPITPPDHIWAAPDHPGDWDSGVFNQWKENLPEETRYRRADLPPAPEQALAAMRDAVLACLAEADASGLCLNLSGLTARTGLPKEALRGLVADLRAEGLVVHMRGLWSEEGQPAGAGYGITAGGRAAIQSERRA